MKPTIPALLAAALATFTVDSAAQVSTFGNAADGNLSVNSASNLSPTTGVLVSGASATDTVLSLTNGNAFPIGSEIVLLARSGSLAGNYEFVRVTGTGIGTITISPPLTNSYSSAVTDVIKVYNYADLTISSSGSVGCPTGALFIRVNGTATISGTLELDGRGYTGGGVGPGGDGFQGNSYDGGSQQGISTANFGGGGAGSGGSAVGCSGGGGGEYAAGAVSGTVSNAEPGGAAGTSHGAANLATLYGGSGGGSGATNLGAGNPQRNGGDGGGIIYLSARTLTINATGAIRANGTGGEDGNPSSLSAAGGGGGGAGGSVFLITTNASSFANLGTIVALGGPGGTIVGSGPVASGPGGAGGAGRIRLDNTTTEGSSITPAPFLGSTTILEGPSSTSEGWSAYN